MGSALPPGLGDATTNALLLLSSPAVGEAVEATTALEERGMWPVIEEAAQVAAWAAATEFATAVACAALEAAAAVATLEVI